MKCNYLNSNDVFNGSLLVLMLFTHLGYICTHTHTHIQYAHTYKIICVLARACGRTYTNVSQWIFVHKHLRTWMQHIAIFFSVRLKFKAKENCERPYIAPLASNIFSGTISPEDPPIFIEWILILSAGYSLFFYVCFATFFTS